MRKNLLKILSLSAMVFALASCDRSEKDNSSSSEETITDANIAQVMGWDTDKNAPVNAGKQYRFKDLVVSGKYGNIITIFESLNQYLSGLKAIEVELSAEDAAKVQIRDTVTVSGKLSAEKGRYKLVDATLESVETKSKEDSPLYLVPSDYVTREYYDGYFDRSWSGNLCEAIFEVATLPETRVTSEGSDVTFSVVFPGEDRTDSIDNYNLIDVVIHHDISDTALNYINTTIFGGTIGETTYEPLKVGDQISYFGHFWFDTYLKFDVDELAARYIEKYVPEEEETELSKYLDASFKDGNVNYTDTVAVKAAVYENTTGNMDNPVKADKPSSEDTSSYTLKATNEAFLEDFGTEGANLYVNTETGLSLYTANAKEEGKDYEWTFAQSGEGYKYSDLQPTFALLAAYSKQFKLTDAANHLYEPTNNAIKSLLPELIGASFFGYDSDGNLNAPSMNAYAIVFDGTTLKVAGSFASWYYTDNSMSAVQYVEYTIMHTLGEVGTTTITLPQ